MQKLRFTFTKLFCLTLFVTLLSGCASGPTQEALQYAKDVYKAGDVQHALAGFEAAYSKEKDTNYYLEKGTLTRLLEPQRGPQALSDSSLAFLEADKVVSNWEAQATLDLKKSSLDLMNYVFAFVSSGAAYEPKDYEKSLLSYNLAINHLLAGRPDLAGVEARKMAQREKLIEAIHEKTIVAIKEKEDKSKTGVSSHIEEIKGYPIEVISSPAINALKNAYQSAAAHYLAGFIFESQNEKGLAAPGYRLAAELKPKVKWFRKSLGNLDGSRHKQGKSDTLVIVETGFVPRIYSQKITAPLPTPNGLRLITLRLPVIEPYSSSFYLKNLLVDDRQMSLVEATNVDTMARRQLKDDMPGYLLKATTQAISQVVAQEVAYHVAKGSQNDERQNNRQRTSNANAVGELAALAVGIAMSTGDADVRAWTTLPGMIYLGRKDFDKGERRIAIPTPAGIASATITLNNDYELVYVRILGNGAVILAQASPAVKGYLKPVQLVAAKESRETGKEGDKKKHDCKTGFSWETVTGFWGSQQSENKDCK